MSSELEKGTGPRGRTPSTATKTNEGPGLWRHALLLTLLLGFTVLVTGGFWVYKNMAPYPEKVVTTDGTVVTTAQSIKGGQAVYQKYGLMDWGSTLGHGAYLGDDFTATTLHKMTEAMRDFYGRQDYGKPYTQLSVAEQAAVAEKVKAELKTNNYNDATKTLTLTPGEAYALDQVRAYYKDRFTKGDPLQGLRAGTISEKDMPKTGRAWVADDEDQLVQLGDFFYWTAWLSAANRPGMNYSYTNNWPYDAAAGNTMSWDAMLWSAVSVALLVLMLGFIYYFYHRYKLDMEDAYTTFPRLDIEKTPVTESQRKTGKFFVVVSLLFLVQVLLGGLLSHYYVTGNDFYGFDISSILPFNIARTWHLQLAILWVATAWLAMGLYVSPAVGGREPKKQGLLVDVLFGAIVIVAVGSLLGEWFGTKGYLGNLWWLLGQQGWEYLELGRIWQVLLAAGLGIWLVLMYRALRDAFKRENDRGGLTHLLFYSAFAIPLFYFAAFFINPGTNITYADYWRWWVIHIWVEGMFEVFAVVVMGYLMVGMGLVTARSTVRALYFQLIILLASGIIGTGHHYYWIGAPAAWIGLGAVFSALEVIPLTLLVLEAYKQYKVVKEGGIDFPYADSFRFLAASGVWNLLGAGVLGFLINLPAVNYFEHGSYLTPTHGHGAIVGVYGFLAVALMLYSMRNIVKPEAWKSKWIKVSFWGLNIGLLGMIVITLLPVGLLQLKESYLVGFWSARSLAFYQQPLVHALLWLRVIPDTVFIVLGTLPLAAAVIYGFLNMRKATVGSGESLAGAAKSSGAADAD